MLTDFLIKYIMITFGILTGKVNVDNIIESIEIQNIPNYEIIVVGPCNYTSQFIHVFYDKECESKLWITKKKNIVIDNAKGDIVVLMKDYILLDSNWYIGFKKFIDSDINWDILMNKLVNKKNQRLLDWVWLNPKKKGPRHIDYTLTNHKCMYVPGNFMIAKLHFLKKHKFDTSLIGLRKRSDVQWSEKHLANAIYKFNINSTCILTRKQNINLEDYILQTTRRLHCDSVEAMI